MESLISEAVFGFVYISIDGFTSVYVCVCLYTYPRERQRRKSGRVVGDVDVGLCLVEKGESNRTAREAGSLEAYTARRKGGREVLAFMKEGCSRMIQTAVPPPQEAERQRQNGFQRRLYRRDCVPLGRNPCPLLSLFFRVLAALLHAVGRGTRASEQECKTKK